MVTAGPIPQEGCPWKPGPAVLRSLLCGPAAPQDAAGRSDAKPGWVFLAQTPYFTSPRSRACTCSLLAFFTQDKLLHWKNQLETQRRLERGPQLAAPLPCSAANKPRRPTHGEIKQMLHPQPSFPGSGFVWFPWKCQPVPALPGCLSLGCGSAVSVALAKARFEWAHGVWAGRPESIHCWTVVFLLSHSPSDNCWVPGAGPWSVCESAVRLRTTQIIPAPVPSAGQPL